MARWIRFIITIIIGASLGLLYGWVISPIEYVDTTPSSLRIDYKSDFVLMAAEAHQSDGNTALAVKRLSMLADSPPDEIAYDAILFAEKQGYIDNDVSTMRELYKALQSWNPVTGTSAP